MARDLLVSVLSKIHVVLGNFLSIASRRLLSLQCSNFIYFASRKLLLLWLTVGLVGWCLLLLLFPPFEDVACVTQSKCIVFFVLVMVLA